ncbi:AI-2E family transporter [Halobacteriales archaeon QS_1_68_20]|nr:MAG: AI-2E family transporter [Halobacteriales archaeon QS_1_68_20]
MSLAWGFLLALVAVLFTLSVAFVMPFLEYFLLAVLLAYLLEPLQRRLEPEVGPRIAAGSIVAGSAVALVLPLVFAVRSTVEEAASLVTAIQEGRVTLAQVEREIWVLTGFEVDVEQVLQQAFNEVQFDSLVGFFGALTHVLIGVGLTLFLLYYFLKDGERFVAWLRETVPLSDEGVDELFRAVDDIMSAVLIGHVLVAVFQGVIAGIGLATVGIPNAAFWTAVMIVLALLPIVGSFLVWGPAAGYLFVTGEAAAAVALFLYGSIVVGISDDYLRPVVVDRYVQINPSVIIIGVLGGLYVLGFMGIFFGPIVIGLLQATVELFTDEFGPVRVQR